MQQSKNSFQRRPRRPARNRAAEIFTISILVSLFMLLGVGAMFWVVQNRIAFVPTPTLTATPEPAFTPTPNVPATLVMEDMLTQVAYTSAQATLAFQTVGSVQTATAIAIAQANGQPNSPLGEPTSVVFVPNISSNGNEQSADAAQLTATAMATNSVFVPNISAPQATDTPVPPTPTNLPGVLPVETVTDTLTPTLFPTETATVVSATDTATPTPTTAFVMSYQIGQVSSDASLYPGMSVLYTPVARLASNTTVNIVARNETGEWLLVCCYNNLNYWTRNYYVRPTNNPTPANAPTGVSGNDIRWLPLATTNPGLNPVPTAVSTPIPSSDYPQLLRDLSNSARISQLPSSYNPPTNLAGSQAGGAYISPLVIVNSAVYGVSADNNLYAIDKQVGNQRWRYNLGMAVRESPFVVDSTIYLAETDGTNSKIAALNDSGGSAGPLWEKPLPGKPLTAIKVVGNKLFVGMQEGNDAKLYELDRANLGNQIKVRATDTTLKTPVVAGNLLFVAGSSLYACEIDQTDASSWQDVWRQDLRGLQTAPVFVSPGIRALAELYVVNKEDSGTRIYVINANTGEILGNPIPGAENAKLLTVTDSYVVTVGGGTVRRFNRSDGGRLADIGIDGSEPMLTSSSGNRLLVVSSSGMITLIDLVSGGVTPVGQQVVSMQAAPAISGLDLYIPGSDSYIYVLRGIQ
ncbi:MAG: PQQ-binding-like beta-propeller repeat protein [Caldilineaceae bacterium]